jgi:hypothetical protein
MKLKKMYNPVLLFILFHAFLSDIHAQSSIKIGVEPAFQMVDQLGTVTAGIHLTDVKDFKYQVYLTAASDLLNKTNSVIEITPSIINYPYTDVAKMSLTLTKSVNPGLYIIVIKGENGPVSSMDSLKIQVLPKIALCDWEKLPDSYGKGGVIDKHHAKWYIDIDTNFQKYLIKDNYGKTTSYKIPNLPDVISTSYNFWKLAIDKNNSIWVLHDEGISKFDGTFWATFDTTNSQIPSNIIGSIDFDGKGNVWIGTSKGIAVYKDNVWVSYNSSNSPILFDACSIKVDKEDNVWITSLFNNYPLIGTELIRYNNGKWKIYNSKNSCLPDNVVLSINFDEKNVLWAGVSSQGTNTNMGDPNFNSNGLLRFNENSLEQWFNFDTKPYNHIIKDSTCKIILQDTASDFRIAYGRNFFIDHSGNKWMKAFGAGDSDQGAIKFDGKHWELYNNASSILETDQVFAELGFIENSDTIFYFRQGGPMYAYTCIGNNNNKCSIKGKVHETNGYMSAGSVQAIVLPTRETFSTQVESDGTFLLASLKKGKYILKAVPADNRYNVTYFPDISVEAEAYVLDLEGKITDIDIYLSKLTGLEMAQNGQGPLVHPNPFTDQVNILNYTGKLEITDITGTIVFKGETNENKINCSGWNEGMYLVKTNKGVYKMMKMQ